MSVRIRTLSKIMSGIASLDRVQDHLIANLNAFMVEVANQSGGLPVYSTSGRPRASSTLHGTRIILSDVGKPEKMQVCLKNTRGGYEWVTVAMSS
jgi:hypothetical protein